MGRNNTNINFSFLLIKNNTNRVGNLLVRNITIMTKSLADSSNRFNPEGFGTDIIYYIYLLLKFTILK